MTQEQQGQPRKSRWRETWPVIAFSIGYMIPLFLLWSRTDFPDGLGVHIGAHGKAGLLESWWYSYLLLERGRFWDVVTFIYMWAAILGIVVWLGRAVMKDRKANRPIDRVDTMQSGRP